MSPPLPSCALCGWIMIQPPGQVNWLNRFRALVRRSAEDSVILTGIGISNDPRATFKFAPLDPEARNDGPDFENNYADLMESPHQAQLISKRNVMFHDVCLSLLKQYSPPIDQTALERLYHTCRSLPCPTSGNSLSWGHDYGGVAATNQNIYFPWEEERYQDLDLALSHLVFNANPLDDSETSDILSETPILPVWLSESSTAHDTSRSCVDLLSKIPPEVCLQIATHLSTSDFLSVRLVCRSFYFLFHNQSFWKSRFFGTGERSWLLHGVKAPHPTDWRYLYHRTHHRRIGPALQNRKRIWSLFRLIPGCIALSLNLPSSTVSDEKAFGHSAAARLDGKKREERLVEGCRSFYQCSMSVPNLIEKISVYMVQLGDGLYVSGLKFDGKDGVSTQVGYASPREHSVSFIGTLGGMTLAIGSRGIRAIQFLSTAASVPLEFIGETDDCPKTRRLASPTSPISKIGVGFDGCKLVSLAIAESANLISQDLRSSAFWYPDVPHYSMVLNDLFFPSKALFMNTYKPIFWSHFGGPRGILLGHLTSIHGICRGYIRKLEFSYDSKDSLSFGRHDDRLNTSSTSFNIDGPGGERIDGVDAYYRSTENAKTHEQPPDNAILKCLKISTNRGRSCLFPPDITKLNDFKFVAFEMTLRQDASRLSTVNSDRILVLG